MRRGRNWRRAYDRDGRAITPDIIGNMIRQEGIRHVEAYCRTMGCGHSGIVCVEGWPPEVYVPMRASTPLQPVRSEAPSRNAAGLE